MAEVSPTLQAEFTNEILRDFAVNLDKVLKSRLLQIGGKAPHITVRLLRYEIMEARASDISAQYRLFFQDSGRLSEMRRLRPGQQLPVDDIIAWIRRGRSSLFRFVPGYEQKPNNLSLAQQEERIAFAIAKSKMKGTVRKRKERKERAWINKNFYSFYGRLVDDFILKQKDFLIRSIEAGFEGAKQINV